MKRVLAAARARRLALSLLLCALVQLMAPTPAQAWFGWLDEWSGPGGWWGVLVDVRLACFGPKVPIKEASDQISKAEGLFTQAAAQLDTMFKQPVTMTPALELTETAGTRKIAQDGIQSLITTLPLMNQALVMAGLPKETWDFTSLVQALPTMNSRQLWAEVAAVSSRLNQAKAQLKTARTNLEVQVGTGVFISLCSAENKRRASVEINANQWFTKDNAYANNQLIWFSTIAPSFTWKVLSDPQRDFLDLGVSAGVYSVASKGFDSSIAGFVLEPVRLDIHAPTGWLNDKSHGWKYHLALVTFRVGLTMFPAGFEPGALAPADHNMNRIKPELIPTYGIFFRALR